MGIKALVFVRLRKIKYSWLSSAIKVLGKAIIHQPVLFNGKGAITIGENVNFGVVNSPYFYTGYGYVESRNKDAQIIFGNNIHINNNCSIISNSKSIIIEDDVVMGYNCQIMNSDFHELNTKDRLYADAESAEVHIKKNVFLGNNVTVLKGVTIGENSVVGAASVVTKSIPDNAIATGNPAKVIRKLDL